MNKPFMNAPARLKESLWQEKGQSALIDVRYAQAAAFFGAISRQLFAHLVSHIGQTFPSILRSVAKYPNRLFEEHEFYES